MQKSLISRTGDFSISRGTRIQTSKYVRIMKFENMQECLVLKDVKIIQFEAEFTKYENSDLSNKSASFVKYENADLQIDIYFMLTI